MHNILLFVGAVLLNCAVARPAAAHNNTLVHLDYSSYRGVALPNGVTQWLGLRYAAPPLGNLRFAAPQPPLPTYGIQDADAHGTYCLGTATGPPTNVSSEDCAYTYSEGRPPVCQQLLNFHSRLVS